MKYVFISLFALGFLFRIDNARAQYVTIPDPWFVDWLQNNGYAGCIIGDQLDTTCPAVVTDTNLTLSMYGFTDVYGIQFFDNLLTLECGGNTLTGLPPLPNTLRFLGCSFNQIDSLPTLPSNLEALYCDGNLLTSIPSLPSTLTMLGLGGNQLYELPPLPSGLIFLNIQENQFGDMPALPATLEALVCDLNWFNTLPTLPNGIKHLQCGNNPLTALPTLPDSLNYLECTFCQFTGGLPALPQSLEYFYCRHSQLTTLPALPAGLKELESGQNPLGSLPVLPPGLTALYCYENELTSLPALPGTLRYLDCDNNQLSVLPQLPDTMRYLMVAGNPDLMCLPPLQFFTGYYYTFDISNTGINCLPNIIQHPTAASIPAIDTVPICQAGDPCAVASCDAPNNLISNNVATASPNVLWNTEDIAIKYRVRVKNMITGQTNLYVVLAPDTTKSLTGLTPNTLYKVQVRSQCSTNGSVLSPWSTPIYFTTSGASTCIAPTNLSATSSSSTSETISWTPVASAAGYQLRYKINGTTTWNPIVINNGAASTQTINALQPNTTYDYQMRTKCSLSPLTWSNYTAVQTFTTPLRLGEDENNLQVQLYPNPSNGNVTFNSNGLVGTLSIYDAVGKTILHQGVSTTQTQLNNLPIGLLTYKFVDSNGLVFNGKFVVVKN